MIKLLYVFDKTLHCDLTGESGRRFVQELIADELSSIDVSQLICTECGSKNIHWEFCRSRSQSFIWDNPDAPVCVELPLYSFRCRSCNSEHTETITTDIVIDKTSLSYHYLFRLIRAKLYSAGKPILELHNLLYGKLCEESLENWVRRFQMDFDKLSGIPGISPDTFLSEQGELGWIFIHFYLAEGRFFMTRSQTRMLVHMDSRDVLHCIRHPKSCFSP